MIMLSKEGIFHLKLARISYIIKNGCNYLYLKVKDMARKQKYGIKYPFSCDNDEMLFIDLNNTKTEDVKSQVLHLIFTQKGQKIRDPEFGTDLIKFIFAPSDDMSFDSIKNEISEKITKYVPNVEFNDISILGEEENGIIVNVEYYTSNGNNKELTKVAIKL